ncbi:MAG: carboxyl-terminal processing protease [Thermoleophilaceae bacterium]|nr:carboxyl-terminal processing protease [Thermoleophilaceae bacterium]
MRSALTAFLAAATVVAVFAAGLYLGGHPGELPSPLRDTFVEKDRGVRAELIKSIEDNYFKKTDSRKLESESLKGVVSALHDRFSSYYTPAEAKQFRQSLNAQFEGIGVTVQPDKRGLKIVSVFDNTPAARAKLRKTDLIVGVNGKSIAGVPSDAATGRIKGRAGTKVTLSILSEGARKPRSVQVERAKIDVPIAKGEMQVKNGVKIAHVRLATFSDGAHAAVRKELEPLIKKGAQGIVLDLRGNGGGLLTEAVLVSSLFVEDGLIVSTKGRNRPERKFDAQGSALAPDLPMVVLVDGGSASASEIVTGALRDRGRATVVGEKTFGKGVFQEVEVLSDQSILELVVGRYFLPKGSNIANRGILPQVKARDLPKTRRDEALPVAVDRVAAAVR